MQRVGSEPTKEIQRYEGIWGGLGHLLMAIERHLLPPAHIALDGDTRFSLAFNHLLRHSIILKRYVDQTGVPKDWLEYFKISWINLYEDPPIQAAHLNGQIVALTPLAKELILRDAISAAVQVAITDSADTIIELGSGWGANIFNLWRNGAPIDANYFACEPTLAGRAVSQRLANMQKVRRLVSVPFDYRAADYSFIPSSARRIVVFTNFSIEQIDALDDQFFDRLMDGTRHAQQVYGINIEPVAWQYSFARETRDAPAPDWARLAKESAFKRGYNKNFYDVISKAEARGVLRTISCQLCSISGSPDYPAATIFWERARRALPK